MKKILCILAVLLLVPAVFCAGAAEEEDWAKAPVITKAYEQSVGKIYIEWEGNAPLYQVFVDGNKVTDTPFNHQILNAGKGTHSIIVYPVYVTDIDSDTKFNINLDAFGLGGGAFHVIDEELAEVAYHNPARMLRERQAEHVATCLFEGREVRPVALRDGVARVFVERFLLDEDARGGDVSIDEVGRIDLHLFFETDESGGIGHAKHRHEQVEPKGLALTTLVAAPFPAADKAYGGLGLIFVGVHSFCCK